MLYIIIEKFVSLCNETLENGHECIIKQHEKVLIRLYELNYNFCENMRLTRSV